MRQTLFNSPFRKPLANARGSAAPFRAATVREWLLRSLLPLCLLLTGCVSTTTRNPPLELIPDMKHQMKVKAQTLLARAPAAGTVAIGHLKDDDAYYTGVVGDKYIGLNPEKIDKAFLERGQQRFNIYCTPCHSRTGNGRGIVPLLHPSLLPANLQDPRVKAMVDGEIFNVITAGRRAMPSYAAQIPEKDRWAIVVYVRALQRTTSGSVADVPENLKAGLK
jgi:mono/diheme cytochrome c family protein